MYPIDAYKGQVPELRPIGVFFDFQDWVNRAGYLVGRKCLCVDSAGRVCDLGKDWHRAKDEGTFPVFVYAPETKIIKIV